MPELDFKTPFDELSELRAVLTTRQIAELTGLRRETISRARPDSRFQRRTEKALGELYLVATRMRAVVGDDLGQLAAVLRRPQAEFAGRSIADLLRDGQVDVVLEHLPSPASSPEMRPEDIQFDPATLAALAETGDPAAETPAAAEDREVAALIEADPDLGSRLPSIEAAIRDHFGPGARIGRAIVTEQSAPEGSDHLYLRVRTELPFDEEIERLADLLSEEEGLLGPVRARLTIGTL
ncbi:MAG: hypothetical protein JSU06_07465 [Actinobacteria bacterium]|nr:hypothetical protein [Actinomycetota bacterium]